MSDGKDDWYRVDSDSLCPDCGSDNLEFATPDADRDAGARCLDCGAEDFAKLFGWTPHAEALRQIAPLKRRYQAELEQHDSEERRREVERSLKDEYKKIVERELAAIKVTRWGDE